MENKTDNRVFPLKSGEEFKRNEMHSNGIIAINVEANKTIE